tara:strand:- start:117 stop:347 length:231 start_codon:yes stop_codon:yes gene_type:complete
MTHVTEHVVNFGDILYIDDAFYRVEDARLTNKFANDSLIKLVLVPRKDETLEMMAFAKGEFILSARTPYELPDSVY